ncbi:MAG: holo-ACP synthase [Myxococcales bacterium]|nr:holo-ACP synthase [Myxococcales bacterium]
MILGIGTDIVDIDGFRTQLADPASSFAAGVFTESERVSSAMRPSKDPAVHLAARYAAKEAFIKAWSIGNYGQPPALGWIDLRDIEVVNDRFGRPALRLHGRVADETQKLGALRPHVSLSHDGQVATAFVILERAGSARQDADI